MALASALLAGVLTRFGLAGFAAAQSALPLVVVMLLAYLAGRRWAARYAVPLTLLVAIVFVALTSGFTGLTSHLIWHVRCGWRRRFSVGVRPSLACRCSS